IPPFTWSAADKAKIVPGAKVTVHWEDVGTRVETVHSANEYRFLLLDGTVPALEICDPASVERPVPSEPGPATRLVGKLAWLADEMNEDTNSKEWAMRIRGILAECGFEQNGVRRG